MVNTFMLLLAFTLTEPNGVARDEIVHVFSQHFDTELECTDFIDSWGDRIRENAPEQLEEMFKEGWKVKLNSVSCAESPSSTPAALT
jgi:hypothetical protein